MVDVSRGNYHPGKMECGGKQALWKKGRGENSTRGIVPHGKNSTGKTGLGKCPWGSEPRKLQRPFPFNPSYVQH